MTSGQINSRRNAPIQLNAYTAVTEVLTFHVYVQVSIHVREWKKTDCNHRKSIPRHEDEESFDEQDE